MWKTVLKSKGFWLGLILSIAGLAVAVRGVDFSELSEQLGKVSWTAAFGIGLLSVAASTIRAYRWNVAVDCFSPVSFKNTFSAFMLGLFGLNVIPARLGEYLRIIALGKNSSVSQSSLIATVVFERVIDGLVILMMFLAAVVLQPAVLGAGSESPIRREFLLMIPAIFFVVLMVLFAIWKKPDACERAVEKIGRRLGRLGALLPGITRRFRDGLVIFSHPVRLMFYIILCFGAWLTYTVYLYFNFKLMHFPLGVGAAMVVMTATVVGAMIPAAPGFVGTYHAFCTWALVSMGIPKAEAFTFSVVTHAVPYVLHVIIGFFCAVRENIRWIDLQAGTGEPAR